MHEESKSPPLRGFRKSPLPDSNRRPLLNQCDPNGSRWQPVATVSRQCSHFGASGDPNLCHPLRPLCSMIKTATGGSRWQRSRVSSSHFSAFGEPNLCHRLRPLCSISIPIRPKRAVLRWSSNRNALRREGVFRNRSPASALASQARRPLDRVQEVLAARVHAALGSRLDMRSSASEPRWFERALSRGGSPCKRNRRTRLPRRSRVVQLSGCGATR